MRTEVLDEQCAQQRLTCVPSNVSPACPFLFSFGHKGRLNENASTTNKDKAKLKNPLMRRHARERRDKRNLSLADRQVRKTARGARGDRTFPDVFTACRQPPFFSSFPLRL